MANQATYDDANLCLRLYELRREEKLREAREWFGGNFKAKTMDDLMKLAPFGSKENAYFRMVVSYWDMAATFVTSGVVNKELFMQTQGELVFTWERIRELAPAFREAMKNPMAWKNLETVGNDFIEFMKSKGPETYASFQALVHGLVKDKEAAQAR